MNITAPQKELVAAALHCCLVADAKAAHPMGGYTLLDATKGGIRLVSTDTVAAMRCTVDGDIKKAGSIAVNARRLLDCVKNMDKGDVQLKVAKGHVLHITATGSARKYKIKGVDAGDFPMVSDVPDGAELDAAIVFGMLDSVAHAHSDDPSRPELQSIALRIADGPGRRKGSTVSFDATDGLCGAHAAHYTKTRLVATDVTIPFKGVKPLRSMVDGAESVFVSVGDGEFFASVGAIKFSCRLLGERQPPWLSLATTSYRFDHDGGVDVDRSMLLRAVKSVSIVSSDDIAALVTFEPGKVTVMAECGDDGDGSDSVPIDYSGDMFKTGYSCRYLIDALSSMKGDTVRFVFDSTRLKDDETFVIGAAMLSPQKNEKTAPIEFIKLLMPRKPAALH